MAVRESFSPAQIKDWDSRRELAGHYAKLAGLKLRAGDRDGGERLYDKSAELRHQFARERPDSWPVQNDLGLALNHQGETRFPFGHDPKAARDFHHQALEIFRNRARAAPLDLDNRCTLARTRYYEATCALHSGDKAEADAGFRECLKIFKELANDPKAKPYHADLMLALARCGEHVEAAQIAEQLVKTPPKDEAIYVQAASGFAVASAAARAAGGSDAALVPHYIDRAVECLRAAKDRGWADVVGLQTDTDLEPIRKEPALQTLLDEFRQLLNKSS
jgi:tetratricopeptide (TPR) repeat protein